ncbi:nitronate monooxygenase [Dietzia timorensis]|uniref:nitronate monooxygenase n=1 Tax=Dietzia timorensis TaxID=499555 RepID=UPI0026F06867|nr:nitronate monooxygenase [Dietzia timorensis]
MPTNNSSLNTLRKPLIAAPMAGGPTTPALVSAAAAAGGMGFLAAGYQSVDALHNDITEIRSAGTELFGVNLFITRYDDARSATSDDEIAEFARTLSGIAESAGLDGPATASFTDNDYAGRSTTCATLRSQWCRLPSASPMQAPSTACMRRAPKSQ